MTRTLGLILKRCAQAKSKSCARKPGGPAQRCARAALIFFRIHSFDDILITRTVKLMELIKMMVKMLEMMKMMEMSRQLNSLNNLISVNPEYLNYLIRAGN